MGRLILAGVVGVVVAVVLVGLVQWGGQQVYPPPAGIDFHDPAQVAAMVANLPTGAFVFVLAAWVLGSLGGAFSAAKIARRSHNAMALVVATFMLAAIVFNLVAYPHPLWMMVLGVLMPVPCALAGAAFARGRAA